MGRGKSQVSGVSVISNLRLVVRLFGVEIRPEMQDLVVRGVIGTLGAKQKGVMCRCLALTSLGLSTLMSILGLALSSSNNRMSRVLLRSVRLLVRSCCEDLSVKLNINCEFSLLTWEEII